ncbi:MAG: tetratricopeptide repeat protein [Tepidisphaeraceae bacterium]
MGRAGLLVLLAVLPFAGSVRFQLLQWDDALHLTGNPFIQSDAPERFGHFWHEPYGKLYVPVAYNVWAILVQVATTTDGSLRPPVFHAANLLLHATNTLLVFALTRRLIRSSPAALLGAGVFAVHPLQVESVCWASEFRGLLATTLGLSAVLCLNRRWWLMLPATVLFALAILSKPSAIAFVGVAGVTTLIDPSDRSTRWRWIWLPAWSALALAGAILAARVQPASSAVTVLLLERPFIASDALAWYASKLAWPFSLSPDAGHAPPAVLASSPWFATLLVWPALLALAWLVRRDRVLLASITLTLIPLLPVLGLVPFEHQRISTTADRYAYVSLLGVGLALARIVERMSMARWPRRTKRRAMAIPLVVLPLLVVRSIDQSRIWHDDATLWAHTLDVNSDSPVALCNLGQLAADDGETDAALRMFHRATQVSNRSAAPWLGIASIERSRGHASEAEQALRTAEQADPTDPAAPTDLASLLAGMNRLDEAKRAAERAIAIQRDYANAWNNLGGVLLTARDAAGAKRAYEQAIRLHPRHPTAHYGLGRSLEALNDLPGAKQAMTQAALLNPTDTRACNWLGLHALERDDLASAEKWFRESLRRDRSDASIWNDLAQTLVFEKKIDEAIAALEQAVRFQPESEQLKANLNAARALKPPP